MALTRRTLDRPVDLLAVHAADPIRFPCLLETVAATSAGSGFDLLLASNGERIESALGRSDASRGGFLAALQASFAAQAVVRDADLDLPFRGGWAIALDYEFAGECEPALQLPVAPHGLPYAVALRAPAAAITDRASGRTTLVAEPGYDALLDALEHGLRESPPVRPWQGVIEPFEEPPQRFIDGVARIHEYLAAGDVFQVNLSRLWQAQLPDGLDPAALYAALRVSNPAPFGGSFRDRRRQILSSSPERLVRVSGAEVSTRPIAGTRPRFAGDDDGARVRELLAHPKERAEHVMLIDLERNDLGRLAQSGSVEVDQLMQVETYAHVHHIVSNLRAALRPGTTPGEVLRAMFPGGTITGAPKFRCMQIIAELEASGRGAYTGALGYLNRDGDMDLNILIRSFEIVDRRLHFRAGSGIVIDSDPLHELDETRAKARGLLAALGARGAG